MAKYNITHSCGHEHEYNLFGKHTERDRKIAWLEKQECPECRRKAEDEAAKEATAGMELPELQGSEKQVKWANTIRAQFIEEAREKYLNTEKAIEYIASVKEAETFIDWRNETVEELLRVIFAAQPPVTEEKPAEAPAPAKVEEVPTPAPKTPTWGKVAVNLQNVVRTTEKAALINMPHNSDYDGFSVWVSLKLLRQGRHSYEHMLSVKADMEFTLKKHGKGRYNKSQVLAEKTISAEEMAAAFGGWVDDAPRFSEPAVDPDKEEIVHHTPAPLTPVEIEADPELTR